MTRRALVALLTVLLVGACSSSSVNPTPTSLPPTTMTSTPVSPPGVADTVRRWVATLSAGNQDDAAFEILAPRSQNAVGGRAGYANLSSRFAREWGVWATTPGVAYDAVPISDGLAMVIIHAPAKGGGAETGTAVMLRVIGGEWRPDPLDTTGTFKVQPADRAQIRPTAALTVDVDKGVGVNAFVDGHAAEVDGRTANASGTDHIVYRSSRPLAAGWHFLALGFVRGDDVSATVIRYEVTPSK